MSIYAKQAQSTGSVVRCHNVLITGTGGHGITPVLGVDTRNITPCDASAKYVR